MPKSPPRNRRLRPVPWDPSWLILRALRSAIDSFAGRLAGETPVVLDFGAGDAPYRTLFTSRGMTYRSADFDSADITISQQGSLEMPDASADLVTSFQVLEHVKDLGHYFAEISRVLRPGGRLLLSTHGSWLYHPHPEDHRRWTRVGLATELETRGFSVMELNGLVGPLAWTLMFQSMYANAALRRLPLVGVLLAPAAAITFNALATIAQRLTPNSVTADNACVYVVLARFGERSQPTDGSPS